MTSRTLYLFSHVCVYMVLVFWMNITFVQTNSVSIYQIAGGFFVCTLTQMAKKKKNLYFEYYAPCVVLVLLFPDTSTCIWSLSPFSPLIWLIRWVGLLHGADGIRFIVCVSSCNQRLSVSLFSICTIVLSTFLPDFWELLWTARTAFRTLLLCIYSFFGVFFVL